MVICSSNTHHPIGINVPVRMAVSLEDGLTYFAIM